VAASTRLLRGEADMLEVLRPETIQEVQRQEALKLVPYPSLTYGFMLLNLRDPANPSRPHPVFGDRATRRALTMAVDRERAVQSVFDSLAYVAKGPFSRAISTADTTLDEIPFDLEGARRLLDSLGWRDGNGDGVRERGGHPLAFTIATPSSSRPRVNFALVLQEQLRQAGARVTIDEMEFNAFLERQRSQRFDAAMVALYADPSPSGIRQHWTTKRPGQEAGSNAGSYSNPTVDVLVDSALMSADAARTKALFKRIYQTIVDDAPAIWLYENRMVAGMHDRIRPTGMRADGWWAHLADWSIPPDERIARDRTPPRPGGREGGPDSAADSARAAAMR
jgi:peptide/nickel transport system substrate-binding protein